MLNMYKYSNLEPSMVEHTYIPSTQLVKGQTILGYRVKPCEVAEASNQRKQVHTTTRVQQYKTGAGERTQVHMTDIASQKTLRYIKIQKHTVVLADAGEPELDSYTGLDSHKCPKRSIYHHIYIFTVEKRLAYHKADAQDCVHTDRCGMKPKTTAVPAVLAEGVTVSTHQPTSH
ncbi:hypothetical protein STEG23_017700 [Scotinomys teguina]